MFTLSDVLITSCSFFLLKSGICDITFSSVKSSRITFFRGGWRILKQVKHIKCDYTGSGGGAFPTMAYTERLRRKGHHFQASVISKGRNSGIHELKYMKG